MSTATVKALKEQGNELVGRGEYEKAVSRYEDALAALQSDTPLDGGAKLCGVTKSELDQVKGTIFSNIALCMLKLNRWDDCRVNCNYGLNYSPRNLKLLFRRSQAFLKLEKFDEAFADLRLLLREDPKNVAAQQAMKGLYAKMQSTSNSMTQGISAIKKALEPVTEPGERRKVLNSILNTVENDPTLARNICENGICELLWESKLLEPMVLHILCKLLAHKFAVEYIFNCVSAEVLVILIDEGSSDLQESDNECLKSTALNLLWSITGKEDEENKTGSWSLPATDCSLLMKGFCLGLESGLNKMRSEALKGLMRVLVREDTRKERSTVFVNAGGIDAIVSFVSFDVKSDDVLQQASLLLGELLPAFSDDEKIHEVAFRLCKSKIESNDAHKQILGVAMLYSLCNFNNELGEALLKRDNLLELVLRVAHYGAERAQTLACNVLSCLANTENGRASLSGPATDLLRKLSTSDSQQVCSSAAVVLAKLKALEFDPNSVDGQLIFSSAAKLLNPESTIQAIAKGIETISFLIGDSRVKNTLTSKDGIAILIRMISLCKSHAKESFAYGISYCFARLSVSEDDKFREKLREMEMTEDQYNKLQELTKSGGKNLGKSDTSENVSFRVQKFVNSGGVTALYALTTNNESERVLAAVAETMCNVACIESVRSTMIVQGALPIILKLTQNSNPECVRYAVFALAKIFVTSNPNLVKIEQLMDSIGPLLRLIEEHKNDLMVFEACMALINIATVSPEVKQRIADENGMQTFEYASYSDNTMVRRAACEAINNLVPTEQSLVWFSNVEKMKIWLLFTQSEEADLPTARAAIGALANAAIDQRVACAINKQRGGGIQALRNIVEITKSENVEMVHRAVVCLIFLTESWPNGDGVVAIREAGGKPAVESVAKRFPSLEDISKECLAKLSE